MSLRLAIAAVVIPVLAVAGCAPGYSLGAWPDPPQPALDLSPSASSPLAVLTYNLQHETNHKALAVLADHLRWDVERSPDFILCQEVIFPAGRRQGNAAGQLAEDLGYNCRATKRTSDHEGVAILSRYPFDYYDELHLKARTSTFLLGFRRVSVMGEFLVPDIGRVRVVNVHFAYWNFEHRVRRRQLQETVEWIARREREVPADVTILGGDFNMKPGRDEFAPMLDPQVSAGLVFQNANTEAPTRGPKGSPNKRIDYIFIAAPDLSVGCRGETLLFPDGLLYPDGRHRYLSDHVPVLHEYDVGTRRVTALTDSDQF